MPEFPWKTLRNAVAALALVLALGLLPPGAPAHAQGGPSPSSTFLKSVEDGDVLAAKRQLDQPGSTLVNTRQGDTGETALHIVVRRRDLGWINFLMGHGADPNARDRNGATPLHVAVERSFLDGARVLIARGAQVDRPNNSGETPLIKAVQLKDAAMVRFLLDQKADPDLTDSVAGYSARDYAMQDRRNTTIARLFDRPASSASGPATSTVAPSPASAPAAPPADAARPAAQGPPPSGR
jgi:ankyrin repeat protein